MNIRTLSLEDGGLALKIAGAAVVALMLFGFAYNAHAALTESQIQSILNLLQSFGADASVVTNVESSLRGTAPAAPAAPSGGCSFTRDLTVGVSGDDVKCLQDYLTSTGHFTFSGGSTGYFGSITQAAVSAWQAANGVSPTAGYFGALSRAKYTSLMASAPAPSVPGTPAPAGTGLTVSAGVQPAATLAPKGAASVPFTVMNVTAGSDGDVTIKSLTVEKRGFINNAVFSGIVILDENGIRLNVPRTLGADNRAVVRDGIVVKAGQTRTLTIGGDMASDLTSYAGQVGGLAVVAVDAGSAVVSGTLPIVGASHTINQTLSLGTVSVDKGALDPNGAITKDLGSTGYTFSAVKLTAGSNENVVLKSVRFQQVGSVSAGDLANLMVTVDGTDYPVTVNGKYYSASFGAGVTIAKGLTKDVALKGDIVSGAARTVQFDIERAADIYIVGSTYGYGLTPTAVSTGSASTGSEFTTAGVPFYDATEITLSKGSVVVSVGTDVPVGNVANGATGASLGAFKFAVTGESVRWTQIKLTVSTSTSGTGSDEELSNVSLYRNGDVIAGPVDPSASGATLTFSDTVNLPAGDNVIVVKGNLNNNWEDGDTIKIQFNPNSDITGMTGDTSNLTISANPSATVSANEQTVKAGALTVGTSASLANQKVINNSTGATLGRITLDATASGEDLKISVIKITAVTGNNADVDELDTIQLFDGATALTTGSNIVNPSGNAGGADKVLTWTLDGGGYVLAKGTSKVIDVKANVKASSTPTAATTYRFNFSDSTDEENWTVTGVETGKSIAPSPVSESSSDGALITIADKGTIAVTVSTADPTEKWYKTGDEATIGIFRFTSTDEPMKLTKFVVGLSVGSGTSSAAAADFQNVSVWDGATKLVEKASPSWNSNKETFDFDALGVSFVVPADDDKDLTFKAKFADIGTGKPGTTAHILKLATTSTASDIEARGQDSGSVVNTASSNAGTTAGARYFKSAPEVGYVSASGSLSNGTKDLYKHTVKATGNDVSVYKFTYKVATTVADVTLTSFKVVEFETGKTVCENTAGMTTTLSANGVTVDCVVNSTPYGASEITLSSGTTYTYVLSGTVTGAAAGASISTQLEGDAAFYGRAQASNVNSNTDNDFIWSDRSVSSHTISTIDWHNGYKVQGLPTTNLSQSVLAL